MKILLGGCFFGPPCTYDQGRANDFKSGGAPQGKFEESSGTAQPMILFKRFGHNQGE